MRLVIETYVSQRRGGMAATSPQAGLAGHGPDREAALASLRRAVNAWAVGLMAAGRLPQALADRDIRCGEMGQEGITVDLHVVGPAALTGEGGGDE